MKVGNVLIGFVFSIFLLNFVVQDAESYHQVSDEDKLLLSFLGISEEEVRQRTNVLDVQIDKDNNFREFIEALLGAKLTIETARELLTDVHEQERFESLANFVSDAYREYILGKLKELGELVKLVLEGKEKIDALKGDFGILESGLRVLDVNLRKSPIDKRFIEDQLRTYFSLLGQESLRGYNEKEFTFPYPFDGLIHNKVWSNHASSNGYLVISKIAKEPFHSSDITPDIVRDITAEAWSLSNLNFLIEANLPLFQKQVLDITTWEFIPGDRVVTKSNSIRVVYVDPTTNRFRLDFINKGKRGFVLPDPANGMSGWFKLDFEGKIAWVEKFNLTTDTTDVYVHGIWSEFGSPLPRSPATIKFLLVNQGLLEIRDQPFEFYFNGIWHEFKTSFAPREAQEFEVEVAWPFDLKDHRIEVAIPHNNGIGTYYDSNLTNNSLSILIENVLRGLEPFIDLFTLGKLSRHKLVIEPPPAPEPEIEPTNQSPTILASLANDPKKEEAPPPTPEPNPEPVIETKPEPKPEPEPTLPPLEAWPKEIDFDTRLILKQVIVNWPINQVSVSENWLSYQIHSDRKSVDVSVNRTGLSAGSYAGHLKLVSGTETVLVSITMKVETLILNPASLDFGTEKTELFAQASHLIQQVTSNQPNWTDYQLSDNQKTITIQVNRKELSPGDYQHQFILVAETGTFRLYVKMKVLPPPLPRVIVKDIWIEPEGFIRGSLVTIHFKASNNGDREAARIDYRVSLDNEVFSLVFRSLKLGPGQEEEFNFQTTWPNNTNSHTILVSVQADNQEVSRYQESFQGREPPPPPNQPPYISSLKIEPLIAKKGKVVSFTTSASDPDGDNLIYRVSDQARNVLGTSSSFTRNDLLVGDYTLTVRATDSKGAIGEISGFRLKIVEPKLEIGKTELDFGDAQTSETITLTFDLAGPAETELVSSNTASAWLSVKETSRQIKNDLTMAEVLLTLDRSRLSNSQNNGTVTFKNDPLTAILIIKALGPAPKPKPEDGPTLSKQQIAFQRSENGSYSLWLMDIDGSKQRQLMADVGANSKPAWSPNGRKIALRKDKEIYIVNNDGSNLTNLTNHQADDAYPSWSPDGKKIVFVSNRDGNPEIYLMDSDGSNSQRLTNYKYNDTWPVFSPDGKSILFSSERTDFVLDLYLMDIDGGNLRKLINNLRSRLRAVFSPNGQTIVFETRQADRTDSDIYSLDINTLKESLLIDKDPFYLDQSAPAWSPDGKKIAFIDTDLASSFSQEVFVFELLTKKITQITNTPGISLSLPAWSPGETTAAAPRISWQDPNFLLQNYPNPANPDTWIPYQLKQESEVTLLIHDARGALIRRIDLGFKPAGSYTNKTQAIHWDGRNGFGELVASGIYFYTLQTNHLTSTRKLIIRR